METTNQLAAQPKTPVFDFFNPTHFDTMQRVCRMYATSELVPDMYKVMHDRDGKVTNTLEKAMANCMIAVEMGQRIGASALMVMQNMIIIYGRPSWSSKFLIATVNTCGRFNPLQYKFTNLGNCGKVPFTDYVWDGKKKSAVTKEYDGTKIENLQCIAFTTAKGSNEVLESSPIDIKLAIKEGWYTKAGSKWQTMTRQMLMYRAASFWTNAYAPELSMGMKTEDELHDIIDVDYVDVSEKVEKEKATSANRKSINIDDAQEVKPEPIKEEAPQAEEKKAPEQAPAEDHVKNFEAEASNELFEKPKTPGF